MEKSSRYYLMETTKKGGEFVNWLLIIVLIILIGSALLGYRKGLIKTVFSMFSTIIALILTLIISPTVNDIMRNNENFYNMVLDKVNVALSMNEENIEDEIQLGDIKEDQLSLIDDLPLPEVIKDSLKKNNTQEIYKALAVNNFKSYISNYFTSIIINALAFIITFVIIIVCLWIISILLDIISRLPVLNRINKTSGLLIGLLQGLFNVWLLFIMLTTFGGAEFGQKIFLMIEESKLLSFIYNNNLILPFVTSATKLFF